jgi:nicotinamidase-related amidase
MDKLDPRRTALVLIDLQKGILPFAGGPHTATDVLDKASALATRFRQLRAPVALVRVGWSADGGDALRQVVDRPVPNMNLPADWWEFPEALGVAHIVIGGISTNIGVESTARNAWEIGFGLVFAEDAMSAATGEQHSFAVENIFPRLGRVRSTAQILQMLD